MNEKIVHMHILAATINSHSLSFFILGDNRDMMMSFIFLTDEEIY